MVFRSEEGEWEEGEEREEREGLSKTGFFLGDIVLGESLVMEVDNGWSALGQIEFF